ncbi:MAG: LysM peptidoglycan-binding domain-containing protein [Elusimicrobia bacterium]|nr:LysM peptidoglycan-binding domain-containing protein [Elusimicrobiota bacterium]
MLRGLLTTCGFIFTFFALSLFPKPTPQAAELFQVIVVQPGESLWDIANHYLKDPTRWNEILRHNALETSDPSVALPGMSLKVPVVLIKEKLRAAELIYLANEVLYRRKDSPEWKTAALKMSLYQEDGLRTTMEAWARVRYPAGEILNLHPNSVAVLIPPRQKAELELLRGEIRTQRARVLTAAAYITPRRKNTDYSAKIKEDLTTLVQVYSGLAAVEAQGAVVEVPAGYGSEVPFDRAPSKPLPLPPDAQMAGGSGPLKGGSRTQINFKDGVIFIEGASELKSGASLQESTLKERVISEKPKSKALLIGSPIQGYRIQLAADHGFNQILMDRFYSVLDQVDLAHEKLVEGVYWVRVALVDLLGLNGRFSDPVKYAVRATPPELIVLRPIPGEKVYSDTLEVEGNAALNSSLEINGKEVTLDQRGYFKTEVRLKPGYNPISFLAKNPKGLETKMTRGVEYALEREGKKASFEPEQDPFEKFFSSIGGGFGLTLLVAGLVIVGLVLMILG